MVTWQARLAGAGLCLALCCAVFGVARADEPARTLPPSGHLSSQTHPPGYDSALVAVPEVSAKALSRHRSGMWLLAGFYLWNLLFPAVFLFSGLSARMRSWADQTGRRWYFTFALYGIAFAVAYYLASLPLYYLLGYVQPHRYDLSTQTQMGWLRHYFKSAAVMLVTGLAVGWVPFLLVRRSPRRWWFYLGLLQVPFLCISILIQPLWIAPLFNQFRPLHDKRLETRILTEAARGGVEASRVYEVNRSKTTRTMNAYVTGFMGSKRIVFFDTMLKALSEDEVLFILGHEMGHYVLRHVVENILLSSALALLGCYAAYRVAGPILARFSTRFGFNTLSDFAALPLGMLLLLIFSLVGMPILMAFSRYHERQADRFGLELTRNNHAAATSFVKLQQTNLSVPRPALLYTLWCGSHPALADRIDFCNRYRPWETGQPSQYERYFKP